MKRCPVLALVVAGVLSAAAGEVAVRRPGAVLRVAPAPDAEVVARVEKGQTLATDGEGTEDWLKVTVPGTEGWVYAELVREGTVAVPKLLVRSGPGIKHPEVGEVTQGETLLVKERRNDWLCIAVPSRTPLWIERTYLAAPAAAAVAAPAAASSETAPPAPKASAPATPAGRIVVDTARSGPVPSGTQARAEQLARSRAARSPAAADSVLEGRSLVESKPQGEAVTYQGKVRPSGTLWARPSRYRLVQYDDTGRARTVCYLSGEEASLERLTGRTVRVSGQAYWLQGVRHPLVVLGGRSDR